MSLIRDCTQYMYNQLKQTNMTEQTKFFKWQNTLLPDQISQEIYSEPKLIKVISFETFTDYNECLKAGRTQDYSMPDSYGGPYLSILVSRNKSSLEMLCSNTNHGHINIKQEEIDLMPDLARTSIDY